MNDSQIFGVSLRGILAIIVLSTVCLMQSLGMKVEEPLYSLALVIAGVYFGQKFPGNGTKEQPAKTE
jgi:hypothetical protein